MPHNPEVKRLRQEGQLEEALELAREGLNNNPEDIKNKRDLGWVLHAIIKKCLNENNTTQANRYLESFDLLGIPDDDTIINENINKYRPYIDDPEKLIILESKRESIAGNHNEALRLFREAHKKFPEDIDANEGLGWELQKEIDLLTKNFVQSDLNKVRLLLSEFLKLNLVKPSKLYSIVLMRIKTISDSYDKFPYFVKEWGLENLNTNTQDFPF